MAFRNVFGGDDGSNPWTRLNFRRSVVGQSEPSYPGRDNEEYLSQMSDIYNRESPETTAYRKHVSEMPEPERVSGMRRIGAALLGAGVGASDGGGVGFQAAQGVMRQPYDEKMQQWGRRGEVLKEQAGIADKNTQRRLDYMREVRSVVKDEQQFKMAMQKYDLDAKNQEFERTYKTDTLAETRRRNTMQDENADAARGDTKTYRDAQIGVSRGQLGVAQTNSRINQQRATTEEKRVAAGVGTNRNPTLDYTRADKQAVDEVLREDPHYIKFIDENNNFRMPKEIEKSDYSDFLRKVEAKRQALFNLRGAGSPMMEVP